MINRPRGVRGGGPALGPAALLIQPDGSIRTLPEPVGEQTVAAGERIVSLSASGGGYGDPRTRDPMAVLRDVVEDYISVGRAREAYAVVLRGDPAKPETLTIDDAATAAHRNAASG